MVSLVLMGAGASYGSLDVVPHPPPLGNGEAGLFARLEEHSAFARNIPEDIRQEFRGNFERGMALYYEYMNGNINAFQRNLATYLAQFTPGASNAYRTLIERLGIRRVVYSTLNYDLLFELSAASLGFDTQYGAEPVHRKVRLLKPHGSCNFWPCLPANMFRNCNFYGGRADISARVLPLNQEQTMRRCVEDDSLSPAIAMYAEGKAVKICPDFVEAQQKQWTVTAANARHIFVSGVRVHRADGHIWDVLAKSPANVTYFGLKWDSEEFRGWKEASGKKNAYFIESDFSSSIGFMRSRLAGN